MIKYSNKHQGFTLIELIIVVVLLGILAGIALPRYMNFTNDARNAVVEAVAGSLSSGINLAHAKWEVSDKLSAYLDLKGEGVKDTKFSTNGWPNGISADGKTPLSNISDGGVLGNDACGQILQKVIKTTNMNVIVADANGQCSSGDFCAVAQTNTGCKFIYRATNEAIIYESETGVVTLK